MLEEKKYAREEKIAVVQLPREGGRTAASLANEYGVHENTIYKWVQAYTLNPEAAFPGSGNEALDEAERLRRRVVELEAENAFLKKVSAYCAKSQR